MATIVFGAIGNLIGGPVGGSIGALLGRQVDGVLFGNGNRQGPRLKDLTATTSTYGDAVPRVFGRMRMPGTIIWSTNLVEHSARQSTGKTSPSVTTYSYTVSFAVALASRPIVDIGRIWADGNLLRGTAGTLNAAGTMRIYTGENDQQPDPLIAAAEGAGRTPACRGIAYVVFEDLDLSNFYNRIPTLTFEVIADQGSFALADVLDGLDNLQTTVPLDELVGFSTDGEFQDALQALSPFYPLSCDAGSGALTIAPELAQPGPIMLDEAALSMRDDAFGGAAGYTRDRNPLPVQPPEILRYYDIDRDYQPGQQRALGRAGPGQPQTVDLPAAMHAIAARTLAERMARTADWSRDTLAWRTAELDAAITPGTIVAAPGIDGQWRVADWEWRDGGVELSLARIAPAGADGAASFNADGGRALAPVDAVAGTTVLNAFELPWDGSGSGNAPQLFAAASSATSGWQGAALYVDHGDGNLVPLGSSGRARAIVGVTVGALSPSNPLLVDRASTLTVDLADPSMAFVNASGMALESGANRALVGAEILQFGTAIPLGNGRWALSDLLRGRGGTEDAVANHTSGECFILLDGAQIPLDPSVVGTGPATIVAHGLGDTVPVVAAITLRGITRRPLTPVDAIVTRNSDGSIDLGWTRRARGAWTWDDGVDVPLNEQAEVYRVDFGDPDQPLASWSVTSPTLHLDAATVSGLAVMLNNGALVVRQQGGASLSHPLLLATLP